QPQGNHPEPKNRQEAQYPRSDQHDANESPKYRRQVALPPFQKTIAHDDELACTSPFLPTTASFRMPAICRILAQDFLLPFPHGGVSIRGGFRTTHIARLLILCVMLATRIRRSIQVTLCPLQAHPPPASGICSSSPPSRWESCWSPRSAAFW